MAADVMMICHFVKMLGPVLQHPAGCTGALPASWQQPQNGRLLNICYSPFLLMYVSNQPCIQHDMQSAA